MTPCQNVLGYDHILNTAIETDACAIVQESSNDATACV